MTPSVLTLAHPDTKAALQGVAATAPGHSQQLADGLAGLLSADPTNPQLQALARLAAGVDQEVDALAVPAAAAPALAQGLVGAADGAAKVTAGVGAIVHGDPSKGWPGTVALVAPEGAPALAAGAQKLHSGTSQLSAGAERLASGLQTLSTGASALSSGTVNLSAGAARLNEGASALAVGVGELQSGSGALDTGIGKLSDGATTLADGSDDLAAGGDALQAGAADLAVGTGLIADGSGALATATAGAAPSTLPWILGIALAGLIAIGFWVGHRISHRRALALAA
ncbi:hypothetical protein [Microbacterium sp. Se5.02b]|uniref:hypothetical protein n=1 Tax=Microbacterium sp. Se5.02b TaxID=2864103 RepID=UPI00286828E4|nr:hypothetical protein [Microbacterium sp. Se5.02b]